VSALALISRPEETTEAVTTHVRSVLLRTLKVGRMSGQGRRYLSYLLRLWQTRQEGRLVWRASLESAHTGERRGFASLAELYAFLEQQTAPVGEGRTPPMEHGDVDL
jgi:hypothetical protein